MSSRKAVGAAPLVTGIVLAFQSFQGIVQSGPSLASASGLLGGCAAVLVGLGILLEWGSFDIETTDAGRGARVALVAVALVGFVAGVGAALV
jgi:hypothetical protein